MANLNGLPDVLPGESMRDYLMRCNSHPSQENRRESTAEEMAASDRTDERLGGGGILTVGAVPAVKAKGKRGKK